MHSHHLLSSCCVALVAVFAVHGRAGAADAPAVCFYEHSQYAGTSWCAGVGGGNVPAGWNDKVSSVRVQPGYTVTLFEHQAAGGRQFVLTADEPNLARPDGFNDTASAYRIDLTTRPNAATPVCLYEHIDYQGGSTCLAAGSADLAGPWNDFVSSVRVLAGTDVTLFADAALAGRTLRLAADTPNLVGLGFNDLASSARVQSGTPPCTGNCSAQGDVVALRATNTQGQAPVKGDSLRLVFSVRNTGAAGTVTLKPTLTSTRFSDFTAVPLGSVSVLLAAGETREVSLDAGPFIDDTGRGKSYALGRGGYRVESVAVSSGGAATQDSSFTGREFTVGASNVVLSAVVYDTNYFTRIGYKQSPETFMTEVVTRRGELFTPDAVNPGTGTYQAFPGGFDEMMNLRHRFRALPGFSPSADAGGYCEQAAAHGRVALGLTRDWTTGGRVQTQVDNHGFDYLNALTPTLGGGATCGWLGVQVSGLFDFDLSMNRTQIVAVHEIGHVYGAPHCDPIQGYVMCSGEIHDHYRQNGSFVWHRQSRDLMQNRFD